MRAKSSFTKYPLTVKENGRAFKIIELAKEPFTEFVTLDVMSPDGLLLKSLKYEGKDSGNTLQIDRKLGRVELIYKNIHGDIIFKEKVDVFKPDIRKKVEDPMEQRFQEALKTVKVQMDSPSGTQVEIDEHTKILNKSIVDLDARKYVFSMIRKIVSAMGDIRDYELDIYIHRIYAKLYGLDILQELDDDIEVGEIMVNAMLFPYFKCDIYYVKNQIKYQYERTFELFDDMRNVFERAIKFSGKELNQVENAMVEASRPNRDRVNIIIPKASDNWSLNIRKFSNFVPDLENMKRYGTIDPTVDKLFKLLVRGKANIGIGGMMGTGKTTMVNFMLTYTKPIERKVIIASVSETDIDRVLKGHDVLIFNVNDEFGFSFSKLVRASLRTTAERVIIPEARGGEFKDLYEANLKTKGNLFTAHATTDEGFLDMCVDMYMSHEGGSSSESIEYIKDKLCKGIDIIVMMRRVGSDIRVKSVSEIVTDDHGRYSHMNRLYIWDYDPENPSQGHYAKTGNQITPKLCKALNELGVKMSEINEVNEILSVKEVKPLVAEKPKTKAPKKA